MYRENPNLATAVCTSAGVVSGGSVTSVPIGTSTSPTYFPENSKVAVDRAGLVFEQAFFGRLLHDGGDFVEGEDAIRLVFRLDADQAKEEVRELVEEPDDRLDDSRDEHQR